MSPAELAALAEATRRGDAAYAAQVRKAGFRLNGERGPSSSES